MTDRLAEGPLRGRRIVVTRRPEQSSDLVARLRAFGADVVEIPLIVIAPPEDSGPLDAALQSLARYQWIAFTSANAVQSVAARAAVLSLTPRWPAIASVGLATSDAVRAHLPGASVAREPAADYSAEGLLAVLTDSIVRGGSVLLPVSNKARDVLQEGLAALGAHVDRVVAYRTLPSGDAARALARVLEQGVDAIAFASPSAVENFVAIAPAGSKRIPVAVIGPVTELRARSLDLNVQVIAQPATAAGLAAALVRVLGR